MINYFSNVPLLILDDLGLGKIDGDYIDNIGTIINNRYTKLVPTIVTTNFTLEELSEMIGGHVVSRLNEGETIELDFSDFRPNLKRKIISKILRVEDYSIGDMLF